MHRRLALASVMALVLASIARSEQRIEFNRDVRPILADHCFACHGPDSKQRQGDLRLDTAEAASPNREGGAVVVAGHPEQSELWRRITAADLSPHGPSCS